MTVADVTYRLIGWWRAITDEDDVGDDILIEFGPNGKLRYFIDEGNGYAVILLDYRIEGNELITDQPSRPLLHRTKFHFTSSDVLVLCDNGRITKYHRCSPPDHLRSQ